MTKVELHELVDALPENTLDGATVFLRGLSNGQIDPDQAWFWTSGGSPVSSKPTARPEPSQAPCMRTPTPSRPDKALDLFIAYPGVWEMTWAPDGRATFEYGDELHPSEPHIIWRRVGTHDIFRQA